MDTVIFLLESPSNTTQLFISPVQKCANLSYFPCWMLPCGLQGPLLLLSCFAVACARVCSDRHVRILFLPLFQSHGNKLLFVCIHLYSADVICVNPPTRASMYSPFSFVVLCRANCIEGSGEQYIHSETLRLDCSLTELCKYKYTY